MISDARDPSRLAPKLRPLLSGWEDVDQAVLFMQINALPNNRNDENIGVGIVCCKSLSKLDDRMMGQHLISQTTYPHLTLTSRHPISYPYHRLAIGYLLWTLWKKEFQLLRIYSMTFVWIATPRVMILWHHLPFYNIRTMVSVLLSTQERPNNTITYHGYAMREVSVNSSSLYETN